MLYFGSFNPVHRGHIAVAEHVVEQGLAEQVVLVVSPQNPMKAVSELAPEHHRFAMAEMACAASRYPQRIVPSGVEFLLPKPSYTIQTLHWLKEHFPKRQFSILMGSDLADQLDRWRNGEEILDNYPIWVYPRPGASVVRLADRVHLLEKAPLLPYSSTEIRQRLAANEEVESMLPPGVGEYIRKNRLWQ